MAPRQPEQWTKSRAQIYDASFRVGCRRGLEYVRPEGSSQ